jgi:ankyrin repeat protein
MNIWRILALVSITMVCVAQATQLQLVEAVKSGDVGTVRKLLAQRANVNAHDEDGYTPLMFAVYSPDMFQLLAGHGADLNAADARGRTVLMHAAGAREAYKVVKFLLEKGTDTSVRDAQGSTALMIAVENPETVKLLLSYKADCRARNNRSESVFDIAKRLGATSTMRVLKRYNCELK